MNRLKIDSVAKELYNLCVNNHKVWNSIPYSTKLFYRKISRWHLSKISKMRPAIKESTRKKLLEQLELAEALNRVYASSIPKRKING